MTSYVRLLIDQLREFCNFANKCTLSLESHHSAHIRQLVCIALRAPTPTQDATSASPKKAKGKGIDFGHGTSQLPPSLNQQKSSFLPSAEATETARKLLISFALTNSPASLFRALPSYPLEPDSPSRVDGVDLALDGVDSYIARIAQCVGTAPNVWALVKPSFVRWDSPAAIGISGKGRKRRSVNPIKEEHVDLALDEEGPVAVVADDAWSVLSWLVLVFQKDESQSIEDNKRRSGGPPVDRSTHLFASSLLLPPASINNPIHSEHCSSMGR